jgi:hypothetical protein
VSFCQEATSTRARRDDPRKFMVCNEKQTTCTVEALSYAGEGPNGMVLLYGFGKYEGKARAFLDADNA